MKTKAMTATLDRADVSNSALGFVAVTNDVGWIVPPLPPVEDKNMLRSLLISAVLFAPQILAAAEQISVTNFYVVNHEEFPAGDEVFWKEDNAGTYTVHTGPIDSGFVRCVGSGFGGPGGVSGSGVCIYGEAEDTFTMRWEVVRFGVNNWRIVSSTGKYSGMTGAGTSKTRVASKFLKIPHRISDWEGEVTLPAKQ